MQVYGSIRVSTREQREEGISLAAQRTKIGTYAVVKEWEIADLIADPGQDVALVSLAESLDATSTTGRLMMNLLASVSQWEREVIGERTKDAMQELKTQGKRYCYARFEEHPGAATLLTRLQTQHAAGVSYEELARQLNAEGIPSAMAGGHWYGNTVRRIIRRLPPRQERKIA